MENVLIIIKPRTLLCFIYQDRLNYSEHLAFMCLFVDFYQWDIRGMYKQHQIFPLKVWGVCCLIRDLGTNDCEVIPLMWRRATQYVMVGKQNGTPMSLSDLGDQNCPPALEHLQLRTVI